MSGVEQVITAAREALSGERAWLVGGVLRDRVLGRRTCDVDLVIDGDARGAARSIARRAGPAACFELSREFGSWRVVARDGAWQLDVEPMRGETLEQDLHLRDFTVNAIAEPLAGGAAIDPTGGAADLAARRLRMVSPAAFGEDPLRVLRLVRVAVELELEPEPQTLSAAFEHAPALVSTSPERVFVELRRILACQQPVQGLGMLSAVGAAAVVLPELDAMRGVEQNRFHHLDVYGHTMEVIQRTCELAGGGPFAEQISATLAGRRGEVDALLAEPLSDGMSRGEAMRWGALLHDAAKPATRGVAEEGRVTFIGHDVLGAELAREVLGRLRASERTRAHVAALVRSHLRLGFLVHESQPLSRALVHRYLRACEPVEVDVTLLSLADRLATRGEACDEAIARHLRLAGAMLPDTLEWRASGPTRAPLRGDELARELGIAPGPMLGELLQQLAEDVYVGAVSTREQALARAHELLATI